MNRSKTRQYLYIAVVALLVISAYVMRYIHIVFLAYVRSGIYIFLLTVWGVSVSRRVIHPQIRRMFVATAALMVFWVVMRSVKFLSPPSEFDRYCWYLYYIPMLFIPMLTAFIAALLGRPENFRMPAWTCLFYIAAGAIALFVLTNDLHRLAFVFPDGIPSTTDYSYGVGYLLPAPWRYGGLLATLVLVFIHSRLPGRGKLLLVPVIPTLLLIAYHTCYLLEFPWLRDIFGDLTLTECLLVVCILECCLMTGLIQSNTGYADLMQLCGIPMVIVDDDYTRVIASDVYTSLPTETLRSAESGPVELGGGLRLSSAALGSGRVLWEDDISALIAMRHELQTARDQLKRRNALRAEEYRTLRKKQDLVEKNRLYDLLQRQTAPKVARLNELLDELVSVHDPAAEDRLLLRTAVLGAYIKRRNNLALLGESQSVFAAGELKNCLDESLRNMNMFGLDADCRFALRSELSFGRIILLYEVFETVIERALDSMTELMVTLAEKEHSVAMTLRLCSNEDLLPLASEGISVHDEGDGEWLVTFALPEGGDAA